MVRPRRRRAGKRPRPAGARERRRAARNAERHRARQQPAYTRYHPELGEITTYPPGYKENAGIFCHTNPWITLAWCALGEGERALETYHSICPSTRERQIDTYRCEPYVYAQMIAGPDAPTSGEAKNSWLTGTAAWTFVSGVQGLLGIVPDYAGLRIDPCIPAAWPGFRVTRRFRGIVYEIDVRNEGSGHGVRSLSVDGRALAGNVVPPQNGPGPIRVEVLLGSADLVHVGHVVEVGDPDDPVALVSAAHRERRAR